MYRDSSLRENVAHGTKKNPITGIHFETADDVLKSDYFFVGRHWHPNVEILFIVKGSYLLEANLENYLLNAGDICFLNSEDLHQITGQSAGTIHDAVIFNPRILDFSYIDEPEEDVIAPFLSRKLLFPHIIRPSDKQYSSLKPYIEKLFTLTLKKPSGWYMQAKIQLLMLLDYMAAQKLLLPAAEDTLSSVDRQKIERYKTIISYIEEHYADPVTLQQLADAIPCNSQYLCRFFKEITGTSPIQYLISCRLNHACTQLTDTAKTVLEISLDCGFDNVSYFIRKFKEEKGCTPKEYRKRNTLPHDLLHV